MTEAFPGAPHLANTHESRAFIWRELDPKAVTQLKDAASSMGITLCDAAFRSGGIIEPIGGSTVNENKRHFAKATQKAIVLGRTKGSSEPNVLVHFPTQPETAKRRYDATYYSYQAHVGDFVREHWDTELLGLNPFPGVIGNRELPDGRQVTAVRFRKNFEPLGLTGFTTGMHQMDTARITPGELKKLVRVLDAIHVDSEAFQQWVDAKGVTLPEHSWLKRNNPGFAYRGKEWWINPHGDSDRVRELTENAENMRDLYQEIDPSFDAPKKIREMIENNIELFPHQDGSIDQPELVADRVVVHGTLYPDNIHIRRDKEGRINFTISGGDRAQGEGLRGQAIDWLVTSTVTSPEHQHALIQEFLRLHPSPKDRRGLAMHVMYRSILEAAWFMRNGKPDVAKPLARLTYDIVNGNGVWQGVNTPLSRDKT